MSEAVSLEGLARRVALLEAREAVRAVAMRYFRLCDGLGPSSDLDELGSLFAEGASWEGRGRYQTAFGRHEGRAAIVAMLASYAASGHFALNAHYLASETIEVTGEDTAAGQWAMLQISTYRDGRSDLRSAHIAIQFTFEDDAWRIARFVTDNIFSRDVAPWNDEAPISVPDANDAPAE